MKRRGSATTHQPVIERGMGPGTEAQPEAPPKRKRGRPRGSGSNRGGTTGRATQVTKPHPIEQQQQQQQQHNMQFQPQLPRNPGLDRGQHLAQYQQHTVAPEQPEVVFVSINNGTQYKCTEKLGEGTYGVVYKAIVNVLPQQQQQQRTGAKERESGFSPQRHNDLVAVKSFKATKDAEGISTTIYREMCLLRELSHENIIKLLDVVLQPEKRVICLVYEYGELDLFKIMRHRKEVFKTSEIKSIMWQILSGIKYMHENWVIHRDIKPSNILVANGTIKIADFGLARIFRRPLKSLSDNGVVVTIWYRAFELLLMTKHYTPAIDIWAIGCIFGELFKFKAMFQGTEKHVNELQEDQLDKIIRVLGTPKVFMKPEVVEAMPRYKEVMAKWKGIPCTLDENYREIDPDGRDLLKKLLCYDPISRITAEEALRHPYFAKHDFNKSKYCF